MLLEHLIAESVLNQHPQGFPFFFHIIYFSCMSISNGNSCVLYFLKSSQSLIHIRLACRNCKVHFPATVTSQLSTGLQIRPKVVSVVQGNGPASGSWFPLYSDKAVSSSRVEMSKDSLYILTPEYEINTSRQNKGARLLSDMAPHARTTIQQKPNI